METKELTIRYGIIYKCTNLINGKIYIGQTRKQLNERRKTHEYEMNGKSKRPFIKALKKYGKENFKWEIIDSAISGEELNFKEGLYISLFLSYCNTGLGYNVAKGGYLNPNEGKTQKELKEIRKKQSESHLGHEVTKQTRKKISEYNTNKTLVTDGNIVIKVDKNSIPGGFKKIDCPFKGTISINNGIKTKKIKKGETIPDGWSVGTSNSNRRGYKLSDEQKYKIKKSHQNRIRVTNGRNNKYIKIDSVIPEGYYVGYTDNRNLSKKECLEKFSTCKGKIHINNGTTTKRWSKNEEIPEGWIKGQLLKNYRYKCKETNKKYFSIREICSDLNISIGKFGSFKNETKTIGGFVFDKINTEESVDN